LINADIARVLNISKATVSKIVHGKRHFAKHTIERVLYYKDYEINIIEAIFKEDAFRTICETVLDKATRKDTDKFIELRKFATRCLRWAELLKKNNNYSEIDGLTIASMNKTSEPFRLFTDKTFWDMMDMGLSLCKDRAVKLRAGVLQDISDNLRKSMR
jgi:hypothetical protein